MVTKLAHSYSGLAFIPSLGPIFQPSSRWKAPLSHPLMNLSHYKNVAHQNHHFVFSDDIFGREFISWRWRHLSLTNFDYPCFHLGYIIEGTAMWFFFVRPKHIVVVAVLRLCDELVNERWICFEMVFEHHRRGHDDLNNIRGGMWESRWFHSYFWSAYVPFPEDSIVDL